MFVDRVVIQLSAGKGGNGVVAWRREKYIPKGGPSGGNGGKGGDVVLIADEQIPSLDWYRNRKILKAQNGANGGSNQCQGHRGEDLVLKVPCGTLVKDSTTGEVLCDMVEKGQKWIACKGGRGGRGNESFKTPTRQAPNFATMGTMGGACTIELELKLIADVGLVGFPNAGKSTLLNALTDVPVKIAAYPFTTLHPNIGHIKCPDLSRIYIADIPGIIEGAHRDRGLGFEFLRHIERTKLLLIVIDASGIDGRHPADDLRVIIDELRRYNPEMLHRPFLVALNKMDSEEAQENAVTFEQQYPFDHSSLYKISANTGLGLEPLEEAIQSFFKQEVQPEEEAEEEEEGYPEDEDYLEEDEDDL